MKKNHLFIFMIVLTCIGFLAGIITGMVLLLRSATPQDDSSKEDETTIITSTTVIERIQQRSFLVTNTIISEEETTITIDYNSAWSNFWWGKQVTAKAKVQTDLGIDLTKIKEEDIKINNPNKIITIALPQPDVYNTSVIGDIEMTSSLGILQKLLADDPNGDFNLAKAQLINQANQNIGKNEEYTSIAADGAEESLSFLLASFEYEVTFTGGTPQ